jgi:hypothetical protein
MPNRTSQTGSELFIVDNSDTDWKVLKYLHDWCQISKSIDIATGFFEIGSILALKDEWQKVDKIRILFRYRRVRYRVGPSQLTGSRLDCLKKGLSLVPISPFLGEERQFLGCSERNGFGAAQANKTHA